MSRFVNPQTFSELVEEMKVMEFGDWVENDNNGRYVELGNIRNAKPGAYILYDNGEFLGGTHDVVSAAQFIAKGWVY